MSRHKDRETALKILFELDLVPQPLDPLLARALRGRQGEERAFVEDLVRGVLEHRQAIDQALGQASVDWRIDRMPTIDRNILRIGGFELLYRPELPVSIVIDEAVELTKTYSTDDARRFINGVLATVAQRVRPPEERAAERPAGATEGDGSRPLLPPS